MHRFLLPIFLDPKAPTYSYFLIAIIKRKQTVNMAGR
jgi:hypothetical protein